MEQRLATPTHIPPLPESHLAHQIARAVATAGGRAWMVGGSVRDALLGRESKDIDLEIHGIDADKLKPILHQVGPVSAVGRSFGVYKVGPGADPIDVALPRAVSGPTTQTPGEVRGAPDIGLDAACRGRDLTLNAIVADPLTGALQDPTGGCQDLLAGRLRAADPDRFAEDPLRVIRVARFAATHKLAPTPELVALCRTIDLSNVAGERLAGEATRALLRSDQPSRFLRVLRELGAWDTVWSPCAWSTELEASIDRAAHFRTSVGPDPRAFTLMLSVMFGRSPEAIQPVLTRLHIRKRQGFDVGLTVQHAVAHAATLATCDSGALDTALRTAAEQADVAVVTATAAAWTPALDGQAVLHRARSLGVLHAPLAPLLFGRDLIRLGVPKGPLLGHLLAEVRNQQLAGHVSTPESAEALVQMLWTEHAPERS